MSNQVKIQYAVDEKMPVSLAILQALQHVIALFSSVVVVPVIVANATDVPREQLEYIIFATIIVTAVSTLIQAVRIGKIGSGYILFTGTSATFLSCSLVAADIGGFALVATMSVLAAPLEFLIAYFLGKLRKVVTPLAGGVVIMLVAITLIPLSLEMWVGQPGTENYHSPENLLVGLVTFLIIAGFYVFGRPAWRLWGPAVGILGGYISAYFMGMVDLSALKGTSFIGFPPLKWPGFYIDFSPEILPLLVAFAVVTVVGAIETVGDAMVIQRVSRRDFKKVDYDSVQGALYSDGVGNILAGLAGTIPNTTYSGNIAIVELTGVASRQVGIFGAGILVLLAFFPWLNALVMAIPEPVLGASMFIFFALLFVTGLKLVFQSGINSRSAFITGISFWIGFAAENRLFFPDFIPAGTEAFLHNGMAVGGVTAFLLTLLFELFVGKKTTLVLAPNLQELSKLKDFTADLGSVFNLSDKMIFRLQLLCEEIFVFLVGSEPPENSQQKTIRFNFTAGEEGLLVEVKDRSETEDLDAVVFPENLAVASEFELAKLGLALLGKMAQEVAHIRISGVNYISFRLWDSEDQNTAKA